jgi:hypothetical protein
VFTSLCFSFGHDVRQLAQKGIPKLDHPYLSVFHDHLLAKLCTFPQVAARNGRHQLASKNFSERMVASVRRAWSAVPQGPQSNQVCHTLLMGR